MTTKTALADGSRIELAGARHMLMIAMRNGGGFIGRADGSGVSVVQLRSLARDGYATLQTEREGARVIVTGAHLTPRGERHLQLADDALAAQQATAATLEGIYAWTA